MTRIYLIRHAEAEGNLYRIAHGHEEGLITDYRGPRQIRALAQRFRDIPVDAVYASDLIRTRPFTCPRACRCTRTPPSGKSAWVSGRG